MNRKPLARSRYTCHASVYSGSLLPSQFLNNTLTIPKLYNLGKPNPTLASLFQVDRFVASCCPKSAMNNRVCGHIFIIKSKI